jgi:hypothetical protein
MTTTNNAPTTPNGRTTLRYDANGALVEQNLAPSTYNRPSAEIPTRPTKPEPKTASELQADLARNQDELNAALEHFSKWQHKDEHGEEKRELKMFLAEFEQRVKESRERLTELESLPSPFVKLLTRVAQCELSTSYLAREAQLSAAQKVALDVYDQGYQQLTHDHQREIYRRRTISSIQSIASNAFHGFSRQDLTQRTIEGANLAVDKIRQALTKIGDIIAKACK